MLETFVIRHKLDLCKLMEFVKRLALPCLGLWRYKGRRSWRHSACSIEVISLTFINYIYISYLSHSTCIARLLLPTSSHANSYTKLRKKRETVRFNSSRDQNCYRSWHFRQCWCSVSKSHLDSSYNLETWLLFHSLLPPLQIWPK